MQKSSQFVLALFLAGGVMAWPAATWGQTQDPASTPQTPPSKTTQTSQPAKPQDPKATTTPSTQIGCKDSTATQNTTIQRQLSRCSLYGGQAGPGYAGS